MESSCLKFGHNIHIFKMGVLVYYTRFIFILNVLLTFISPTILERLKFSADIDAAIHEIEND